MISQGITVYGDGWSWSNADDSITRYIRIRMGRYGTAKKDAIGIADGKRMIFDHVSVTWGRDETFSINGDVSDVTIQDCIIGQGLVSHSCGGLVQTDGGVSLFRNLYIDNKTRNPKVKGVTLTDIYMLGSGFECFPILYAGTECHGHSRVIDRKIASLREPSLREIHALEMVRPNRQTSWSFAIGVVSGVLHIESEMMLSSKPDTLLDMANLGGIDDKCREPP